MLSLATFREHLDLPKDLVYLNTAATSPTPDFVRKAMGKYEEDRARRAEQGWDDWVRAIDDSRKATAAFFRARSDEVAFVSNTGHGINTVANMISWDRGAEIVTSDLEFPSNLLPWRRLRAKGVRLKVVRSGRDGLNVDRFVRAINRRTQLVAISWVSFLNGQRFPLREIAEAAHRRDADLFVDAIQGAGALRPDFRDDEIDFLACGGHKWLMSPFGVGTLLVRRDLIRAHEPAYVGWYGLEDNDDFSPDNTKLASTARRYEIGNLNFGGVAGWRASMEAFVQLEGFEQKVLENAGALMDGLDDAGIEVATPRDQDAHAGIVCAALPKASQAVEFLAKRNIVTSLRGNYVRLSPHFWNTHKDLEAAMDALESWVSKSGRRGGRRVSSRRPNG